VEHLFEHDGSNDLGRLRILVLVHGQPRGEVWRNRRVFMYARTDRRFEARHANNAELYRIGEKSRVLGNRGTEFTWPDRLEETGRENVWPSSL
jgi:hypothetical protein